MAWTKTPREIRERLAELRRVDRRYEVHGVADHRYELRAPLTSDELAAAEAQFGVSLPEDYAFFLTELGAGGAGPGYGLFPLVLDERTWKWSDEDGQRPGDLASPFPHTSEWNFDDHPLWADQPTESQFADVEAFEDADSTWRDDLEALFWQPQHTRGAVCLGHLGCGLLAWLVVSGPERGHVWSSSDAPGS
ncbi:MAG: SMI1/KNR4 family protein, partial [Myxococcales bacterium]|nr:SMI1/KNR4 family protein [Myxococcales bacterium]